MLRMPSVGRAHDLGLQADARAVAGGDLHHRLGAVLQGERRSRPRRPCAVSPKGCR